MIPKVNEHYTNYTAIEIDKLQALSDLILSVAEELDQKVAVSIKWGQLSFASKSGTPIRIDRFDAERIALFVHCQTTLVEEWREMFGDTLDFSKTRAIVLNTNEPLPINELKMCMQMALTYKNK